MAAIQNPYPLAGIRLALAFALLTAACTSVPTGSTRIRELHTFAIVAADEQGVLPPTDLAKVRISIVQYLTSQGYVRSDQVYTDDIVHADMVFRVRIAWIAAGKSFLVTEVAPTYGGAAPARAGAAEAAEPDVPWSYDPSYDDSSYSGYCYGPYAPWILAPFAPIYVWAHRWPPTPPIVHHPPYPNGLPEKPPSPWRKAYTRDSPRPAPNDNAFRNLTVRRPDDLARDARQAPPPTWPARNPDADYRPPQDSSAAGTPRPVLSDRPASAHAYSLPPPALPPPPPSSPPPAPPPPASSTDSASRSMDKER